MRNKGALYLGVEFWCALPFLSVNEMVIWKYHTSMLYLGVDDSNHVQGTLPLRQLLCCKSKEKIFLCKDVKCTESLFLVCL